MTEADILAKMKVYYNQLTELGRAEIHTLVKEDLGLMAAYPWRFSLAVLLTGAFLAELVRWVF